MIGTNSFIVTRNPRSLLWSLVLLLTLGCHSILSAPTSSSSSSSSSSSNDDIANSSLLTLNNDQFTKSIQKGMWFIEFFSPYCRHCKKFAPTWKDVTEFNANLQDSSDFHMARVDCIAQSDLCDDQSVDSYPFLQLYMDGAKVEKYVWDRNFESLDGYIKARAADYRQLKAGQTRRAQLEQQQQQPSSTINMS